MRGPFKNTGVCPDGDVVAVKFAGEYVMHIVRKEDYNWDANVHCPIAEYWLAAEEEVVAADTKLSNPKDAIAGTKIPLWLLSGVAKAEWALAQFAGQLKYAAWNWRIAGVRSSVYLSAMQRHMDAYINGEEYDPVDGTHHLGNIMACCAIIIDAKAANKLTDDRPPSVSVRSTYKRVEEQMAVLKEKYKDVNVKDFTIEDTIK